MSKIDIQHAFRILRVHPSQWILLDYHCLGKYFVDTRLPFGLRSSLAIFNDFADTKCWILHYIYLLPDTTHYSDDFLFVSPNGIKRANQILATAKTAFEYLGIPIALDKLEGSTTKLTYLGIEIDSSNFTINVPDDKYNDIMQELPFWKNRKKCTKKELLSFIGKLSFICKVVCPGRIFLRRLIDLSTTVSQLHYHINPCSYHDLGT